MTQPMATIIGFVAWHIMRLRALQAMRKVHFGFLNAKNVNEIEAYARESCDTYYDEIRKQTPLERRLEYKMGDG